MNRWKPALNSFAITFEGRLMPTTHSPPRLASTRTTSKASWAERLGRNPKLHGRNPASNTGEVVPGLVELEVAVLHLGPAAWQARGVGSRQQEDRR